MEPLTRLTIAVPTYNREGPLRQCLDHILEQVDDGVEVVICDNASSDGTPTIIAEYARRFPMVRPLSNDSNLGLDGNVLRCLRESRGRFIKLLSDDDVLLPGGVAKVLEAIEKWKDAGFIYLNSRNFSADYDPQRLSAPFYRLKDDLVFTDKDEFLKFINVQATFISAMVLNREKFLRIDNPERFVGTYILQTHVAVLCAASGSPNVVIARPCVAYRSGNSGGYNVYQVFGGNWKRLLFETGLGAGFSRRTLRAVYSKTIKSFLRPMAVEMKINNTAFDSSGIGALFKLTWTYPAAWLYLYPFVLMPPRMARFMKTLIATVKSVFNSRASD